MDILIIDDIPINRRLLRAVLEGEGHEVREAADGVEALDALHHHQADAVISDILMPRMDGYRLCYEIRSDERLRQVPFMFYTSSYTSKGDEKLALEMGADRFLIKPAPAAEIMRVLQESLTAQRHQAPPAEPARDLNLMKEYNQQLVAKLEQKNTELTDRNAELNTMHLQMQRLLEHSPAVLYQLKIAGEEITPLMVSDNLERQLGVPHATCLHHDWWFERLHPEDRDRVVAGFRQALRQGGGWMEYRLRHQDQSYRWIEDQSRVIRDAAGEPVEMIGVWTDITERKEAEIAVHASEALSRGVLNSVMAHIAVLDRHGRIIAVNEAWRQHAETGTAGNEGLRTRPEIGMNYLEVCRNSHGPAATEAMPAYLGLLSVLRGERGSFALEYPCHSPGEKRWFFLSATPLQTREGGAVVSHLDISARKRAEEKIAEQAALLDKARDAIIVRDLEGHILFWNEGAERMYGWKQEEVVGQKIASFLYTDASRFYECNDLAIRQGEWSGELQQQTKDQREISVEARWTLVLDENGKPRSVLAINTDVTEKKRIEAQFMRAQRMESIGTLAGGIAHDLNNILSPILMSIDILKAKAEDARTRHILETIEVSARRGAGIVRQVLSFARGMEGERVEIQPKHLLRDIENILRETFPKDIHLQFFLPYDTWTVLGDPTQVHQILLNLCVNARDAMPEGGTLTARAENCDVDAHYAAMHMQATPGRYVNISVTDTGTGMASSTLDKIFEPFFTTKAPDKGTGLGLSTVMSIVKTHGGFINVASEPGKGTSFKVYLPALDCSDRGHDEIRLEEILPRGNGETVLVVDDEASILTITGQTLQAYGYHVLTSTNGAEALAIYAQRQDQIHVVLTDMMMPILDGPAMILALLRINPQARIIAASGLEANSNTAKVTAAGVTHFLNKPYTAGTLLKQIRDILDQPVPGPVAA